MNNSSLTVSVSMAKFAGFFAMSLFIAMFNLVLVGCGAADEESSTVGLQGPKGEDGAQGPAGKDGTVGVAGPQGPAGKDGDTGATGATGPQGPAGATGATGQKGEKGEDAVLPFELCSDDEDCDDGEVCNSQGICVPAVVVDPPEPECSATKPCATGFTCGVGGTCAPIVAPPECNVNADCWDQNQQWCSVGGQAANLVAYVCSFGECVPKPQESWSCPYGCYLGSCLPFEPECEADSECDDGDGLTLDTCVEGECKYVVSNPPSPVTCRSLTLKPGFQFFGLVADPAANGEPIGEWAIFPTSTVTWCGEKVFAFNVATDNAEGEMDWVLYGTQDANGNTCPEAAQSYPQGLNYTLTDVFQGSLPAEVGCVRRCTTGGWVNWVCQSPN